MAKLLARVADLEEKLASSSRNSSKPPSSDPPTVTREPKAPTGRKPGGQPGHKRHTREMFPPEKVRSVTDCKPERCAGCNHRLGGEDPEPHRHQVAELPKFEPLVDEFRLHTLACERCGCRTRGVLPEGTATGAFGPTIVATITLLLGAYGLSRRDVAELMPDLFGLPISVGGVVGCQKIGADALAGPHAQVQAQIPKAPVKYADETGWKLGHVYACLWVVVTPTVTLFRIQAERSRAAAMKVLGKVHGLLGSDRYVAYDHWPTHMHQFCWAHLARLFVRFSERRDPQVAAIAGHALYRSEGQIRCSSGGIVSATAPLPEVPSSVTCAPCSAASPSCSSRQRVARASRRSERACDCCRTCTRSGPSSTAKASSPRTTPASAQSDAPSSFGRLRSVRSPSTGVASWNAC